MNHTMNFPASYTALDNDEMTYTSGGSAVETVAGGALAVGAAVALTYVGGSLVGAIGSAFGNSIIGNVLSVVSSVLTAPGKLVGNIIGSVL